jgi:pimeloyl-ACP methyl ester carboxylesterase
VSVRRGQAWPLEPLALAEHSYFWVGVERTTRPDGRVVQKGEHMYVEYFVPAERRQDYPLVFIHGGGGQSVAWLGPGDGSPGWVHFALAAGYAVYLVDRPGHGRNPPHLQFVGPIDEPTSYDAVTWGFRFGAENGRWPGSGDIGDPGVDQFMAQQRPMRFDTAAYAHGVWKARSNELLDRIGPAIVVSHSAGGPFGWITADARPDLVKTLVAVEPLGVTMVGIPLTYDPPISSVDELRLEPLPAADVDLGPLAALPRLQQADPPRRLVNLARVPIVLVTSDDPRFRVLNADTASYLRHAGVEIDDVHLADHGIHGNGHFMTLEDNSSEVFALVAERLAASLERFPDGPPRP